MLPILRLERRCDRKSGGEPPHFKEHADPQASR
jgi:hypothetical protein